MDSVAERVVIIGGGHNGLVAAFYLAKAGFSPLVLEKREVVGGVAAVEEIHPGFRCPAILYPHGPLIGLPALTNPFASLHPIIVLDRGGPPLRIYEDPQRTASELAAISDHDAKTYPEFESCLNRLGDAIRPVLSMTPPDMDHLNSADYLNLLKSGLNFRRLPRRDAYRLLRWIPMPVADLTAEWFENELLRAALSARGIFGTFAGPRSAGSSVGLLMEAAYGRPRRLKPAPTEARGTRREQEADLAQTLAKLAVTAGAEIRTNANVSQIRVKDGRAQSVVLDSGEEIGVNVVISSADPRRTFLQFVDAKDLDPGFLLKVRAYRAIGTVAKVNFALSALPAFSGIRDVADLAGRLQVGPDTDYLERAFDAAKYGEMSPQPYLDIRFPSVMNPSLVAKGGHVMSVHAQYAPYRLKIGDWKTRRDELANVVVRTLSAYAPNLRSLILGQQVITPLVMEETYGLSGGHIFHGEHALDQLFAFRPVLGWARYRTPIKGLYLCGAGAHPGGGITGLPGANASREIIADLKSRR